MAVHAPLDAFSKAPVMAGLDPAIHVFRRAKTWIPGISLGSCEEDRAGFPPPCGEGQGGDASSGLDQRGAYTPTSNSSPQGGGGLPALSRLAQVGADLGNTRDPWGGECTRRRQAHPFLALLSKDDDSKGGVR